MWEMLKKREREMQAITANEKQDEKKEKKKGTDKKEKKRRGTKNK
jgi:hypothetical protein